ncbi:unannotated protein [freshwater metagenome]|uniref:Unannotated protein n=1 Tax=freshwater metagenome TaxID=449393 RepID=A0A6J7FIV2_9ZZZZ|nr:hypothetical protein [Actinomycetota bacterium]
MRGSLAKMLSAGIAALFIVGVFDAPSSAELRPIAPGGAVQEGFGTEAIVTFDDAYGDAQPAGGDIIAAGANAPSGGNFLLGVSAAMFDSPYGQRWFDKKTAVFWDIDTNFDGVPEYKALFINTSGEVSAVLIHASGFGDVCVGYPTWDETGFYGVEFETSCLGNPASFRFAATFTFVGPLSNVTSSDRSPDAGWSDPIGNDSYNGPPLPSETLTVSKNGNGDGEITSNALGIACGATCSASFPQFAGVALTNMPAVDSTFDGWSGACTGVGPCVVPMNIARSVTGTFSAIASNSSFAAVSPARLMETRFDVGTTVDTRYRWIGQRDAGSVTQLRVAGRGGVPGGAVAVVLNVTVTRAEVPGFVTVFPCGSTRPSASSLNFAAGQTVPNAVIAKVGVGGTVCLFTSAATDLIVDVNGYFPSASPFVALSPARLMESRVGVGSTVDSQFWQIGQRAAGSVTELRVAGRGGTPDTAVAVALNVTVTGPQGPGFVTVFPCGSARPSASSLNFVADQTVPNAVLAKVGSNGSVCIFTSVATDLIVDVDGYFPVGLSFAALSPARLMESRYGEGSTVDTRYWQLGPRAAGSVTELKVTGRGGVPSNAVAVVLNVTVAGPQGPGFVTIFPCGSALPGASNLNYSTGQTVPNMVIAKVGAGGSVCLFTSAATDLIVDVNGTFQP